MPLPILPPASYGEAPDPVTPSEWAALGGGQAEWAALAAGQPEWTAISGEAIDD